MTHDQRRDQGSARRSPEDEQGARFARRRWGVTGAALRSDEAGEDALDAYLAVLGLIATGLAAAHVAMAPAERAIAIADPLTDVSLVRIAGF